MRFLKEKLHICTKYKLKTKSLTKTKQMRKMNLRAFAMLLITAISIQGFVACKPTAKKTEEKSVEVKKEIFIGLPRRGAGEAGNRIAPRSRRSV